MSVPEKIVHPIPPIWTPESRVLILGTMPSPRSRQAGFYYAHPRNRFWPVLAAVYGEKYVPETEQERRDFLRVHRIALWDVLRSCRITGAADDSIAEPVQNPIEKLLAKTDVRAVFTTGNKAAQLYRRLCEPQTKRPAIPLPSTSPANARCSLRELTEVYQIVKQYTEGGETG